MRPKYKLARAARENLREISEYWAGEAGPDAAVEVVSGIMETIITLSGQPTAAERFGAGVRKFPAGRYMIYYRLHGSRGIEILHVFHGAREQRKAWKPKGAPNTG